MRQHESKLSRRAVVASLLLIVAVTMAAKPAAALFAVLSDLKVSVYSMQVGGTASATATLTDVAKSPIPVVAFTSSDANVAKVPSSKIASDGRAVVTVTGVAPGCARITAAYGGRSRVDDVVVHPVPGTTSFGFKVPEQIVLYPGYADATLTKTVRLDGSGSTFTIDRAVWTLTSSNTNVAKVPSSVTQVSTSTTFKITGAGEGCAIITAKLGTQSISRTVLVRYIGG